MDTINDLMGRVGDYSSGMVDNSWDWFNGLNREEWILVLAITASVGFFCMMFGYGNHK